MAIDIRDWIKRMPKAEIHVHLEGTIGPETLLRLASRYGRLESLPSDEPEGVRKWLEFTSFRDFVGKYIFIASLLRTADDFRMLVEDCGRDMAEQGILYREVTVTPFIHADVLPKKLAIADILQGLDSGRRAAKDEYGVEIRWVFDIPRNVSFASDGHRTYLPFPAERTLEYALEAMDLGCVGFGLGGDEVGAPPAPFAHAFLKAKEAGLWSLPHAGETAGPESVWSAVRELKADRIGHGVRSFEDPELLLMLSERQIPLEVNISSNICLHVYTSAETHPFAKLDKMGLFLTINSDDPPMFDTSLVDEYLLVHDVFAYDRRELARFARQAFTACAAEDTLKSHMLAEFDRWAKANLSCTDLDG